MNSRSRNRSPRGGIIPLFVGLLALSIAAALALAHLARVLMVQKTQSTACEAAALEAARQMSRIVMADPYYGYISLCDYPPVGKGTLAADGEPLPVVGINTLLAGARCDLLIARKIGDEQMLRQAELEYTEAQRASRSLQSYLRSILKRGGRGLDLNGESVRPYDSAYAIFQNNLDSVSRGMKPSVRQFSIALGWLDGNFSSHQPIAQPSALAELSHVEKENLYVSGVNEPVGGHDFYFAAFSPQVCLTSASAYRDDDGKRVSSVIKVRADVAGYARGAAFVYDLQSEACALPPLNENPAPHSLLVFHLPHGLPACAKTLQDLIACPQAARDHGRLRLAAGGDFGKDSGSQLVPGTLAGLDSQPSTSQVVATVLYDWIASARGAVRIDSLQEALTTPLAQTSSLSAGRPYLLLEITPSGIVLMRCCANLPFNYQRVQDNQAMLEIPSGLDDGQSRWTVTCFDNMANHGSAGGKHGGQALSPNCLNWCELPAYDLTGDQAFKMGRGGTFLGLSVAGDGCGIGGGVGENGVLLKKGQEVNVRRSYYSGGLAGYIELAKAVDEVPWQ